MVDREWYKAEALRQLNDPEVYTLQTVDPNLTQVYKSLRDILSRHGMLMKARGLGDIATFMLKGQIEKTAQLPKFYLIIKVHKTPIVGRPICASIDTITYNASRWLDIIVQPLLRHIPAI